MADISKVKLGTIIYNIKDIVARKIMKGAGANEAGEAGQVPAPPAGTENRYLRSDGTWQVPAASIITQDNAHRFVTDAEKTNWNGKVNTGDIVNNCTSTATNKPLSAAQGKALWDKYTQLNGDLGGIVIQSNRILLNPDESVTITIPNGLTFIYAVASNYTQFVYMYVPGWYNDIGYIRRFLRNEEQSDPITITLPESTGGSHTKTLIIHNHIKETYQMNIVVFKS